MNHVRVVTDSACDLPQEIADELGIEIVPLTIRFGSTELVDRQELSTADFWSRCAASASLPETAAPAPGAFEQSFRRLAADGATGICVVSLSSDLSATMQSARLAAEAVAGDIDVDVVDSRSVTIGQGLIAMAAARAARDGGDLAAVATSARSLTSRTHIWGALDTLENLRKGGRIGNAKAMLASVLSIKPIIEVRDGKVEEGGKQRTRSKALAFLVEKVREAGPLETLAVMHADTDDVGELVARLQPLAPGPIVVGDIGPVVGTHAGRGTIGVVYQVLGALNDAPIVIAGRYRLERLLAAGTLADVWAAVDEVLDRPVAVKILKPALTDDIVAVSRFRREARLAARVNHPNVVAVYDTVSGDGCDAMVQELVTGRTLRDALDEEPKLSIGRAVRIGIAVADALSAVHEVGIVHRDVKPANVLLAGDGRVLLTDFGIATRGRQDLTSEDVMMGTAKYLSPEQVEGEPASARADLYSLGVVLYECLAGRPPFLAESEAATALARLHADPIPLRTLRPAIPSRLATLVRACLARHPDDRPRSAATVRDALVRLAPEVTEDDTRPRLGARLDPARRRRRPVTAVPSVGNGDGDGEVPDVVLGPERARRARRWPWLLVGAIVALVVAALGLTLLTPKPAGDNGQAPPDVSSTEPAQATPATFTVTSTTAPPVTGSVAVASTVAPPVGIVTIGEFDPPPGDGRENPGLLRNLLDDNTDTIWSSLCYDEVGLGAKEGVGLVFELSGSAAGHVLEVASSTRRWSASVFVSDSRPPTLRAWGPAVSARRDITTPTIDLPLEDASGRFVLLWVTRLGTSPVCKLPYDIRISEVKLVPR